MKIVRVFIIGSSFLIISNIINYLLEMINTESILWSIIRFVLSISIGYILTTIIDEKYRVLILKKIERMKILNNFHLKIIALITMIIDHLGTMFFEDYSVFRIIGRIAFILYAFMLVEGYFHTKNIRRYLSKLFLWALISEIPFDLANYGVLFNFGHQNIFWTLFLSALGIHWLEKNKELGLKILICLVILFLALIFRVDYSIYGVSIIFWFYYFKKERLLPSFLHEAPFSNPISISSLLATFLLNIYQGFAILGLIPIYFYNGQQGKKTGNIYYSFYTVHLGIFAFIKYLMIN